MRANLEPGLLVHWQANQGPTPLSGPNIPKQRSSVMRQKQVVIVISWENVAVSTRDPIAWA